MIRIEVESVGHLPKGTPTHAGPFLLPECADGEDLLGRLRFGRSDAYRIALLVNGERSDLTRRLRDGDRVVLLILAGGG
ncbi:MAG: hypothetical protein ACYS47_21310 [Planctomycetota bacterium]|jgi:hypothetical protein